MTRGARVIVGFVLAGVTVGASAAGSPSKAVAPAAATRASAPASAAASAPVEFDGTFAAGTTYVGEMFYDAPVLKTWRPVKDVQPGNNVAWTVHWTNLERFPALKSAAVQARPQRFRFRVLKADVVSGSPHLPWTATYQCEVLAVERVAAAPPQAGSRRR